MNRKFQIRGTWVDEIPLAEATANADKALAVAVEKRQLFSKAVADDVEDGWQHVYCGWYTTALDAARVAVRLEAKVLYFPRKEQEAHHYSERMNAAGLPQYDHKHIP